VLGERTKIERDISRITAKLNALAGGISLIENELTANSS
jgi:hypothetical protein